VVPKQSGRYENVLPDVLSNLKDRSEFSVAELLRDCRAQVEKNSWSEPGLRRALDDLAKGKGFSGLRLVRLDLSTTPDGRVLKRPAVRYRVERTGAPPGGTLLPNDRPNPAGN
jgi:hypothetical protein